MITRQKYMSGKATFADYYTDVAKSAGLSMVKSPIMPRVNDALAKGDESLNTIPLKTWDVMGASPVLRSNLQRAFKERGDSLTLAGIVCVLKQAAINAAVKKNPRKRRVKKNPIRNAYGSVKFTSRGRLARSRRTRRASPIVMSPARRARGRKAAQVFKQPRHRKFKASPRDLLRSRYPVKSRLIRKNPSRGPHVWQIVAEIRPGQPGAEYGVDAVTPQNWIVTRKPITGREYGYSLPDALTGSAGFRDFMAGKKRRLVYGSLAAIKNTFRGMIG